MSEDNVTFERARGGITTTGPQYEVKIILWLFLRGLSKRINFQLACNVANLGNFDDVLFKYEEDGKWKAILLQLKHKENEKLDEHFLFDKLLYQCCDSYNEIKKDFDKEGLLKGLTEFDLNFVIFTNGELPEQCNLTPKYNCKFLNNFLNINLYSDTNDGNKAKHFDKSYYERCICESFKGSASYVLRKKSDLKTYFITKFGTDNNNTIVSAIRQLPDTEIIEIHKKYKIYEEYENFLSEVVLFHKQPNETKLDAFILDEIKDVSDFNPTDVYGELLDYFTQWHDKSNIVLTKNNIYEVLQEYSKPNKMIRKYFDNQTYIPRNIYKEGEQYKALEVNKVEDIIDKTPMIISGAAGIGKTSFINYLFKLNPKNFWFHKIKLNGLYKILKNDVANDIELLKQLIPYNNEAKSNYFINFIKWSSNRKLFFMVDGYDEIDECYNERITRFLTFLSKRSHLIVTTRTGYAKKLTHELEGNLYYFKELCENDCKLFIKNHSNLENIDEVLEKILLTFKKRQNFLYNPLHLQMSLEYINNHFNEDNLQSNADSLYSFYKSFIEEKIKIYLSRIGMENVSKSSNIIDNLENEIMKMHKYFAIRYLNFYEDKQIKDKTFLQNEDFIKIGFIDDFDRSKHPNFIHRTFAEYFYAIHLFAHLDDEECRNIIKKEVIRNEFLGNILNTIIITDSAERFNIIEDDVELFKQNVQKDDFGRTLLHLAFAVGAIKIATFLIDNNFYDGIAEDINGDTPLHYLIVNKIKLNEDMLKKVINKCGVNCVNFRKKNTPLHVAAEYDFREIIDLLMNDMDCNVNLKNADGYTPLLIATKYNHIEIAEKLVTNDKCNPNFFNYTRENPLLIAAQQGHTEIIKLLIESNKLYTNCIDASKSTPLHLAAYHNYPEIVDLLLEKMVPQINSLNVDDYSPLYYAAMRGNTEVVRILLNYDECDVNLPDQYDNTALHMAVHFGHLTIVDLLIKHKTCNVNALNDRSKSPLHIAVSNNFIEIAEKLMLNDKCNINVTSYGSTPLHFAVDSNNQEIVKLLISNYKCDINSWNFSINTALHLAVCRRNQEIVKMLIEHKKCDLNIDNYNHSTPLHVAMELGCMEIIELLIANTKCNVNSLSIVTKRRPTGKPYPSEIRFGIMPLHFAVKKNNVKIVELLINREDCNLNCRNRYDETPLHIAVKDRNVHIVKLLISKSRCDLNCEDYCGKTPITITQSSYYKCTEIINLLRQKADEEESM